MFFYTVNLAGLSSDIDIQQAFDEMILVDLVKVSQAY